MLVGQLVSQSAHFQCALSRATLDFCSRSLSHPPSIYFATSSFLSSLWIHVFLGEACSSQGHWQVYRPFSKAWPVKRCAYNWETSNEKEAPLGISFHGWPICGTLSAGVSQHEHLHHASFVLWLWVQVGIGGTESQILASILRCGDLSPQSRFRGHLRVSEWLTLNLTGQDDPWHVERYPSRYHRCSGRTVPAH